MRAIANRILPDPRILVKDEFVVVHIPYRTNLLLKTYTSEPAGTSAGSLAKDLAF
jgi:hypothetical protein